MTKPRPWRQVAVEVYFAALYLILALDPHRAREWAIAEFRARVPEHDVVEVWDFLERWGTHFREHGNVDERGHVGQHTIPPDVADRCIDILLSGWTEWEWDDEHAMQHERRHYFRSVHDAVVHSPYLAKVLKEYDVTECTLLRTLQHRAPGLRRRHLHYRRFLSDANRWERVQLCSDMLDKGKKLEKYLNRVFWIDSKTIYVVPSDHFVYAPPGIDLTVVDRRLPQSRQEIKKIVYYCVVNAALGPVYIEFMTGSTEHETDPHYKQYRVSIPPPSFFHRP